MKPLLKWVGGKTQIMEHIVKEIPLEFNDYHEIFVGGGSVLLTILSLISEEKINTTGNIYAYDSNYRLIKFYEHIQKNKDELFDAISRYMLIYDSITGEVINRKPKTEEEAQTSKESYYYWLRSLFNNIDKDSINSSALFLILNKTCFRGLYREGPNGFNVPYGHYKTTPVIIEKHNLDKISFLVKNVHFICSDFKDSIKNAKPGDYVYLDPPYAPENKTSFVEYTANGFTLEMHEILFDNIKEIHENNIKFTMSNAKVDLVTDSFKDFQCKEITARRAINCKNPESSTKEVIIYN